MEKAPLLGEGEKSDDSKHSKQRTVKESDSDSEEVETSAESKRRTVKESDSDSEEVEKSAESKRRTVKESEGKEVEKSAESKRRKVKESEEEKVEKSAESKQKKVKESDSEEEEEEEERKSLVEKALNQTLASTAHLANLLPTGTVLAFQILCPILSNSGHCDEVSTFMTECLLVLCALSCFLISFTDSFRGSDGKLHYGFATSKGLWTFENLSDGVPEPGKYKIGIIDFVHAFLSVLVFSAIALLDGNVVRCLYPAPSFQTQEVLDVLPVTIGVLSSLLFVVFPTTRHGIGYPVSSHK